MTSTWNDDSPNDSPSILICNIPGVHFQSLLPLQQHIDVQVHPVSYAAFSNSKYIYFGTLSNLHQSGVAINATNSSVHQRCYVTPVGLHYVGSMSTECIHCGALSFCGELFKCCHHGEVSLPQLCTYPKELLQLLTGNSDRDKHFQTNIRYYNSSFAFASMGAVLAQPSGSGPPCF